MPRYTTVIPSSWRPQDAFAYLSDFANAAQWDPGVVGARRLGSGPIDVNAVFELDVKVGRRQSTLRYRITQFEATSRVQFVASTTWLKSVDTLTFNEWLGGCEVTYDAQLHFRGVAAIANPILGLVFRRIGDRARDSLRELLGAPRAAA